MAAANFPPSTATSSSTMLPPPPHDNGTTLIARAEALNAFMKMQPAANQARHAAAAAATPRASASPPSVAAAPISDPSSPSCFCFGAPTRRPAASTTGATRPPREYYPDNLSVQPAPHPWDRPMEWLIVACVDFLEANGLHERNLFAVSAVDDLVRAMTVPLGSPLPPATDPHVAAGVIKAKIRHADEPLVAKSCLRAYIDAQNADLASQPGGGTSGMAATSGGTTGGSTESEAEGNTGQARRYQPRSFRQSFLSKTIDTMEVEHGVRRAYILGRIMRLLGRVSANIEVSRMNAHSLAKCVAPSMLHWDPNSNFALLMLGKITAYVMTMIEDARVFDEILCQKIDQLRSKGDW